MHVFWCSIAIWGVNKFKGDRMKEIHRIMLYIILTAEVVMFSGFYVYGTQGLEQLWRVQQENENLAEKKREIIKQIDQLEHEIADWNNHDFHKEKIAREQLQMAHEGDEIFYLT